MNLEPEEISSWNSWQQHESLMSERAAAAAAVCLCNEDLEGVREEKALLDQTF